MGSTGGLALSLDVEGGLAYVGAFNRDGWFDVIDVSDPASPKLRGTYETGQEVQDIEARGGVAYLANDANGLVALDVSHPDHPTFLAGRSDGTYANTIELVDQDHAYVSYWYTDGSEFQRYDLTRFPERPWIAL